MGSPRPTRALVRNLKPRVPLSTGDLKQSDSGRTDRVESVLPLLQAIGHLKQPARPGLPSEKPSHHAAQPANSPLLSQLSRRMFPFCIVELWRLEDTARRLALSTE